MTLGIVNVILGLRFGTTQLAVTALAQEHDAVGLAGVYYLTMSVGSLVASALGVIVTLIFTSVNATDETDARNPPQAEPSSRSARAQCGGWASAPRSYWASTSRRMSRSWWTSSCPAHASKAWTVRGVPSLPIPARARSSSVTERATSASTAQARCRSLVTVSTLRSR